MEQPVCRNKLGITLKLWDGKISSTRKSDSKIWRCLRAPTCGRSRNSGAVEIWQKVVKPRIKLPPQAKEEPAPPEQLEEA